MSKNDKKIFHQIDFTKYFNNPYNNKPYRMLGAELKNIFSCNVYKPVVDAGFTCPNRDGTKSTNGCIYCNNCSFRPNTAQKNTSIKEQIDKAVNYYKVRFNAAKYLIYFQPHSNTYANVSRLRKVYYEALKYKNVIGLAIGTRADCINENILDLLEEIADKYYLWLELGLQTIHKETLELINRQDTYQNFINTLSNIKKRKNINVCVHLIHGLPFETKNMMLSSVKEVTKLNIDGLKFHQLYIVKNTKLEQMYLDKKFILPSLEEYLDIIASSLLIIPKEIIIHRLFGISNLNYLVAPRWGIKKAKLTSIVDKYFIDNYIYQGKNLK